MRGYGTTNSRCCAPIHERARQQENGSEDQNVAREFGEGASITAQRPGDTTLHLWSVSEQPENDLPTRAATAATHPTGRAKGQHSMTRKTTPEVAPQAKARPPLTPEQREQKNARDRQRRATLATAKADAQAVQQQTKQISASHSAASDATFEGSIAHQQAQRDRPFQRALGASLQAQDKARAERIRISQRHQPDRK